MNEQQAAEMLALLRQIATDIKESKEVLAHWDSRGLPPENTGPYTGTRRKPKVQSAPQ